MKKLKIYYPIIIGGLFFILITIVFAWNEKFDISKAINHEKLSNYFVTIFTSIGTCLSVYYLYKQIQESKYDSLASAKPVIEPVDIRLFAHEEVFPFQVLAGGNWDDQLPSVALIDVDKKQRGEIELKNIGNGLAQNVRTSWKYDLAVIDNCVKGIYFPAHGELTLKKKDQIIDDSFRKFVRTSSSFFIIPPSYYCTCCGEKLNVDLSNPLNIPKGYLHPKPKLELHISYEDIRGTKYLVKYLVKIEAQNKEVRFLFELDSDLGEQEK